MAVDGYHVFQLGTIADCSRQFDNYRVCQVRLCDHLCGGDVCGVGVWCVDLLKEDLEEDGVN